MTFAIEPNGFVHVWGANDLGALDFPTIAGACSSIDAFAHIVAIQAPKPAVFGVQPISGPSAGGTQVTIRGERFTPNSIVLFGGTRATASDFISSTTIRAVTPSGFPGPAVVSVDSGSAVAFYYRPECGSDLDQNGIVDAGDVSIILLDFGPCYEPPVALAEPAPTPLLAEEAVATPSTAKGQ
jgi:hypothetical protein